MAKPFSIKKLADLAQVHSAASAARLGILSSQERGEEERLQLLIGYRQEYQIRLREFSRTGIDQPAWRNFRTFMDKLDTAIADQHRLVAKSRDNVEAGRSEWHSHQRKLKSFDTLSQRYVRAENASAAKREQKDQDERSLKSHGYVENPLFQKR